MADLSDTQERVLIALVDLARDERDKGFDRRWHLIKHLRDDAMEVLGVREATACALEREGMIAMQLARGGAGKIVDMWEAQATDAGIALCDGMGD
jgi:hypothetical protein